MSKFSRFAVKKLYFKRSFNSISGNRGPFFSQINFDKTCFGEVLSWGLCPGVFCPGCYVLEPLLKCARSFLA